MSLQKAWSTPFAPLGSSSRSASAAQSSETLVAMARASFRQAAVSAVVLAVLAAMAFACCLESSPRCACHAPNNPNTACTGYGNSL